MPRFDPGQSGVTNNANVWVAAACDPTGQLTTPTFTQVTAFGNHTVQPLVAGRTFRYRFSPKAANTLAGGNVAVNSTDWIYCNAAGVAVPHLKLLYNITSNLNTNVTVFEYVMRVNFTVKGTS